MAVNNDLSATNRIVAPNLGSSFSDFIASLPLGKSHIIYVGQAGYIIKSASGKLIAIDIYLSDCVERVDGFKRLMPYLFGPNDIEFDYILASHAHFDHFDVDAMPALMQNGKTKLMASTRCAELVDQLHIDASRVTYVSSPNTYKCEDFSFSCVFCDHGAAAPDAVGFILSVDGITLYFAGDTCLRSDEACKLIPFGPFDAMIAPINGHFGNLSEADMVSLCSVIQPRVAIPCHYWCFAQHGGDPGVFIQNIIDRLPAQKYKIMAMGESVVLQTL